MSKLSGAINLRDAVVIQTNRERRGPDGAVLSDWVSNGTVKAKVEPIAGREFWQADAVQTDLTHRVVMRWWAGGLTSKHRLVYQGRIMEISSVINVDERNRWLELMCIEA